MEFVTGKPIPYESIRITGNAKGQRESGMFPRRGAPAPGRTGLAPRAASPKRSRTSVGTCIPTANVGSKLPVLGTTA